MERIMDRNLRKDVEDHGKKERTLAFPGVPVVECRKRNGGVGKRMKRIGKSGGKRKQIDPEQIARIQRNEAILNELSPALRNAEDSLSRLASLLPEAEKLAAYYGSEDWKQDFSADERGLLPDGLNRGVLSEDAVYDLLERLAAFKPLLNEYAETESRDEPKGEDQDAEHLS
ncbi:MAG: DUF4298 domain-containing protein [Clostridia bacterium]|nr:DUF4298 domain-containing protein [Clostridia bacterium]